MPARPDATADHLPETLGHYRILDRLGKGGMGTVYLALDTKLNRKVALKVCHVADSPAAQERFKREAQAMASLRHASLCPVFDFDVHDGLPYFEAAQWPTPTASARSRAASRTSAWA